MMELLCLSASGGEALHLKRESWLFGSEVTITSDSNLCQMDEGTYTLFDQRLQIDHPSGHKKCRLDGFYDCNALHFQSDKKQLDCDGQPLELSGLPINETTTNRDLAILNFVDNQTVDFCKQAYEERGQAQKFLLNSNQVYLSIAQDTEQYIRECYISGDITEKRVCSSLYFTRLGAVCVLGSDSALIPFRKNVTVTDLTEGVLNHYRPSRYDFSLTCEPGKIHTKWIGIGDEKLEEEILIHPRGYIQEVLAKDNQQYLSHRFNKRGHYYEVLNLARLVENPKPRQTTWQYYQPSIVQGKKFTQTYFWVNYLGSLIDCCKDNQCQTHLHGTDFLKSRLPAEKR